MWNDPAIATADLKLIQLGQYIHICERNGKEMFDQCIEWDKMNMLKKMLFLSLILSNAHVNQ